MADTIVERRTILLEIDGRKLTDSVGKAQNSLNAMSKSFDLLKVAAQAFVGSQVIQGVADFTDKIILMNNQLHSVTDTAGDFNEVQQQLFEVAQNSRTSFSDTIQIFTRLDRALESTGRSHEEIIQLTDTLNKAFKATGVSGEQAAAGMLQLSQAFASGRLAGDEFRSVSENAPVILKLLSEELGVSTGALKEMASQGLITADVLANAIKNGAEEVNAAFEKTIPTLGELITQFTNYADLLGGRVLSVLIDLYKTSEEQTKQQDLLTGGVQVFLDKFEEANGEVTKFTIVNNELRASIISQTAAMNDMAEKLKGIDPQQLPEQFAALTDKVQAARIQINQLNGVLDESSAKLTSLQQATQVGALYPGTGTGIAKATEDIRNQVNAGREALAIAGSAAFPKAREEAARLREQGAKRAADEAKKEADRLQKQADDVDDTIARLANKGREIEKKASETAIKGMETASNQMADFRDKYLDAVDDMVQKAQELREQEFARATSTPFDDMIESVKNFRNATNSGDFGLAIVEGLNGVQEVANTTFQTLSALSQGNFAVQKGLALANALINGALAITKTFAELGATPAGFAAAALIGGITAAQVAVIAQQQPTERASGGAVAAGRRYSVGERSAEMYTDTGGRQIFIPPASGSITPKMGRGGDVNIINQGPPLQVVRQQERGDGGLDIIVRAVQASEDRFEASMRTGQGKYARALQGTTSARRTF